MAKPKQKQELILSGVLRLHFRGFGFLQADDKKKIAQDVFIPKHLTLHAVDGDRVEVLVHPDSLDSEKGPEGKVITILERSRTHLAGIVCSRLEDGDYAIYSPVLGKEKKIVLAAPKEKLRTGDRLVMKIKSWGNKEEPTYCLYSHSIGSIEDASLDNDAAIEEFGLRAQFPNKVRQEALRYSKRVSTAEIKTRKDMRSIECVTIDPDTAKDFDDAVSVIPQKKRGLSPDCAHCRRLLLCAIGQRVGPGSAFALQLYLFASYLPAHAPRRVIE